jgi:AmmeMemoRadiSam system protein A
MTSQSDRQLLLRLAREAIVGRVNGIAPSPPEPNDVLARLGGVFVSLHKNGDLRGCIGRIEANEPLGVVVPRCAVAACSSDPRFPAVSASELVELDIELSLLGALEPVAGPEDLEIGRHGLVVEMGRYRGLLLPQVATERRWDRETFLAQTCDKAGLPRDCWKQGAKVSRFEAEVFGEGKPASRRVDQST